MSDFRFNTAFVNLRVTRWVQSISNNSDILATGLSLQAQCTAIDDFQLRLTSGEQITEIGIDVNISRGPLTRGEGKPLEHGIGQLNYISTKGVRPPSAIGCWLGLPMDQYNETWAQVRSGAFTESTISLDVAPVAGPGDPTWKLEGNRGHLYVLGAAIHFSYKRS